MLLRPLLLVNRRSAVVCSTRLKDRVFDAFVYKEICWAANFWRYPYSYKLLACFNRIETGVLFIQNRMYHTRIQ